VSAQVASGLKVCLDFTRLSNETRFVASLHLDGQVGLKLKGNRLPGKGKQDGVNPCRVESADEARAAIPGAGHFSGSSERRGFE
jgi:hypothetical protein